MLFILLFGRFSELAVFRAATERTTRKTADTHKHNQSTLDVVLLAKLSAQHFSALFYDPDDIPCQGTRTCSPLLGHRQEDLAETTSKGGCLHDDERCFC